VDPAEATMEPKIHSGLVFENVEIKVCKFEENSEQNSYVYMMLNSTCVQNRDSETPVRGNIKMINLTDFEVFKRRSPHFSV
jgi:hypothetical protein